MVRWRACLVLAVLLLLPRTGGKADEDEDDEYVMGCVPNHAQSAHSTLHPYSTYLSTLKRKQDARSKQRDTVDESDEDDDDDDDEEEDEPEKREPPGMPGRRALIPPPRLPPSPDPVQPRQRPRPQSRGAKNLPFECFVCSYKNGAPLRSCLDPVKYRVHSVTCHSLGDKCYTTVTSKDKSFEEVVRGCRAGCVDTTNTKCCEANRCNNQAFAMPLVPETLVRPLDVQTNKATKPPPPSVLFFVTILLLLQTVVKAKFRIRKNKTSSVQKSETLVDESDECDGDKATKPPPPSVLFFITILLLLQTVVKVSFV